MSFGIPTRNGLSLGLGAVPTLATNFGLPIPSLSLDYTIPSDGTPGVVPGFYQVDNGFGVLTQTTFSSLITFSRASNATRFSPTGQLEYAPHNLLLQSQTFDNASWTKSNSSITANAATAPDGTITADKEIPANGVAGTYIAQGFSATSGTTYTYTVYAKASEFSELRLLGESGAFGSNTTGVYNLSTGVASVAAGSPTVSMTSVGNGWWRCVWTATATATTTGSVQQRINTTGDGTSGLFIWGAQLSVGPNALDYTPTTTAVVYGPRFDYNPSTLVAQGLLIEEQRTNSLRNNTMVGASAPSTLPTNWLLNVGGLTIGVVGTGTENGIAYIDIRFSGTPTQTFASVRFESNTQVVAANGQTWTNSFYVRRVSGSNTNITSFENRIFYRDSGGTVLLESSSSIAGLLENTSISGSRTTFAYTSSAATTAFVNSAVYLVTTIGSAIDITLRIGLPQLEQGAFATSVIPTTTAATTRSADIASIGTLSPWYNATEGTLYAEASPQVSNVSGCALVELSTDVQNRIGMFKLTSTGNASLAVLVSNVTQASTNSGAWTATGKMTGAYATNDFASSLNGSAAATDATGTVPTVTTLTLGRRTDNANVLNGHLRRITYTPRRLTNAELQSLTS
jgi:hypothetical protein